MYSPEGPTKQLRLHEQFLKIRDVSSARLVYFDSHD